MKIIVLLMFALLSMPTVTWAGTVKMRCPISHFKRAKGEEMRSASIRFNNGDPVNAATIERLTIYDFFGKVVHDSGPAVGIPHPLNTDIRTIDAPDGWDITTVPPNATYYIRTNHIRTKDGILWDNDSIPDLGDDYPRNTRGNLMSVVVEFSKRGNHRLFVVGTRSRSRQRVQLTLPPDPEFGERDERSSNTGTCFRVPRRDDHDDDNDKDDDDDDDDDKGKHRHRDKHRHKHRDKD